MGGTVSAARTGYAVFCSCQDLGLPYGEEIVGTITAVDTFLGVLLGISTANYNKQNGAGNSQ